MRGEERLEMAALPVLSPEALGDPVEPWTTNHSAGLWGQARALQPACQPRLPWPGLTVVSASAPIKNSARPAKWRSRRLNQTAGAGPNTGGYTNQLEFCGCRETLQENDDTSALVGTEEVVFDV